MKNSLNIYKVIADCDTPVSLLSTLADKLTPLSKDNINHNIVKEDVEKVDGNGVYVNYLHFFKVNKFYIG
jgi:hypothetical protein